VVAPQGMEVRILSRAPESDFQLLFPRG